MPYQFALTIVAPVRAGEAGDLDALLEVDGRRRRERLGRSTSPALTGVHFARFVLARGDRSTSTGEPLPAQLVYMSDVDVSPARHLRRARRRARRRASTASSGTARATRRGRDARARLAYLRRARRARAGALRQHGRPHRRRRSRRRPAARGDRALPRRAAATTGRARPGRRAAQRVRELVEHDPALAWARAARREARRPRSAARDRAPGRDPAPAAPAAAVALLAAPVYLVVLRRHERRDPAPHLKPPPERVPELAALEDHVVQNPFTAVGFVKPGRVPAS